MWSQVRRFFTLILGLFFTFTKYGWFTGGRLDQRIHPHTA
jgi:hypothetical protein